MSLLSSLPGVPIKVREISDTLAHMWDGDTEGGEGAPSGFHAIQMNLVLHFGPDTTEDEAKDRFDTAVTFAQRYPCRIIVLSPASDLKEECQLQAKLFSQCYIGPTFREMCCCEALLLDYREDEGLLLDQQLSVWLENDLPIYYWLHRVPLQDLTREGWSLTRRSRRLVYDSAVDGRNYLSLDWPLDTLWHDLAYTRSLHLRQTLGHWLGGFSPAHLVSGLDSVELLHKDFFSGDAGALLGWLQKSLNACARQASLPRFNPAFRTGRLPDDDGHDIQLVWRYQTEAKHLTWTHSFSDQFGSIKASLNDTSHHRPLVIRQMDPELALAEALFF